MPRAFLLGLACSQTTVRRSASGVVVSERSSAVEECSLTQGCSPRARVRPRGAVSRRDAVLAQGCGRGVQSHAGMQSSRRGAA
eukprot:308464-Chlamydomonas_euryale.AAC.1